MCKLPGIICFLSARQPSARQPTEHRGRKLILCPSATCDKQPHIQTPQHLSCAANRFAAHDRRKEHTPKLQRRHLVTPPSWKPFRHIRNHSVRPTQQPGITTSALEVFVQLHLTTPGSLLRTRPWWLPLLIQPCIFQSDSLASLLQPGCWKGKGC